MPQFDTFSFFSQLFWVFIAFTFLYLSLTYYLLPSIAIILKVRKRKLASVGTNAATTTDISTSLSYDTITESIGKATQVFAGKHVSSIEQSAKLSAFVIEQEVLKTYSSEKYQKVSDIITI